MYAVLDDKGDLYKISSIDDIEKNFKGWRCNLGKHTHSISTLGLVRFSSCNNQSTHTCEMSSCQWKNDIAIPKGKDENLLNTLIQKVQNNDFTGNLTGGTSIVAIGDFELLKNDNKRKIVRWHYTDICYWSCSYCPDRLHNKNIAAGKYNNNKFIIECDVDIAYDYYISGGEPFSNPYFFDDLRRLYNKLENKDSTINIETNGSTIYSNLMIAHKYASLIISIHHEYMNETYYNNLKTFLDYTPYTKPVTIRIFKNLIDKIDMDFFNDLNYKFLTLDSDMVLVDKELR